MSLGNKRPLKPAPKPMLVVNAKQNGTGPGDTAAGGARLVRVPVGENVNAGNGVHHYLLKRDPASGKQIFYSPEIWGAMSDKERADARNFAPVENEGHKALAADLVGAFRGSDPLAKRALLDEIMPLIRAEMAAASPAPAPKGGK